jgi:hypothetical protein
MMFGQALRPTAFEPLLNLFDLEWQVWRREG